MVKELLVGGHQHELALDGLQIPGVVREHIHERASEVASAPQAENHHGVRRLTGYIWQFLLEHSSGGEEQAAIRLEDHDLVWRNRLGRIFLDEHSGFGHDSAFDRDPVRLGNHHQDQRDSDTYHHRPLQRNRQGEHEGDTHHRLLHPSGLPDRLEIVGFDGAIPNDHQEPRKRRHGDVTDQAGEHENHDRHDQPSDEQRQSRFCSRRLVQGGRGHRTADRHALENASSDIGNSLPGEIA